MWWWSRVPKLVKGGVKVASIFNTSKGGVPYAIVRTNPYIIARIGSVRGSKCGTVRLKFNRTGRGGAAGPLLNAFRGTKAAPGRRLTRFAFSRSCGLNSAVAISLFTSTGFINIINASGNHNFRNIIHHRRFNNIKRSARNRSSHLHTPNSINTYSCPTGIFGNVHVTNRVNGTHIAARGLEILGIVPRDGLLVIGNSITKCGNSAMLVGV